MEICNVPRLRILECRRLHIRFPTTGCVFASRRRLLRDWGSVQQSALKELSSLEFRCSFNMVCQSLNNYEAKRLTDCFRMS